jgi:site-specific DNA recombinase
MSHKKYFSYIRVSTQRQGQTGTSLTEQQAAIERFAQTWSLSISKRFEERETAAKQGRPVFLDMLKQLRQGGAHGVIIHKIDRSARNLKDWADLGSLIDSGLEVHFASESLDLSSRGGRLSADIQAVVASDYIRNLREETKKGLYGRLKQGLFPFRAVAGYLDTGKGQPKRVDPIAGPLIRQAFEMYATGDWGLIALADRLFDIGLRNKNGRKVTLNGLSTILHNPFYAGVIRIKKTREVFEGIHQAIISKQLFEQVQDVLAGKNIKKQRLHFFVFRRLIRCANCGYNLIPERQKGSVYYRCHTRKCLPSCLKEEVITAFLVKELERLRLTQEEFELFKQMSEKQKERSEVEAEKAQEQISLQLNKVTQRLSNLLDAYTDGVIEKETYFEKKNALVFEQQALKQSLFSGEHNEAVTTIHDEYLELANSAYLSYEAAKPENKRELAKTITSNFTTDGKSVAITLQKPFQIIAERLPLHRW